MTDCTTRVRRLAYVRVSAPDPSEAENFLEEFGLQVAMRAGDDVYLRGTDPEPPCYILSRGSGGVTAIGFETDSVDDLEALARIEGATAVEPLDGPCGGMVVRLRDPQGMTVEVAHGRTPFQALTAAPAHAFNMDGEVKRQGSLPKIQHGPSRVRRIGHLVLESADPASVYAWYHQHLGLKTSDTVSISEGDPQMIFSRIDRGAEYVDHHVVGFQFALDGGSRVQHIAFEVGNVDDLMSGHEYLKRRKRKHVWGIGRHRLGGQIFDYWKSPWGVIHEHWTDTDLLNHEHEPTERTVAELSDYWGPEPSPAFIVSRWNLKTVKNVARLLRARAST